MLAGPDSDTADLIADIDACEVPEGHCTFWWLGQHGFVVKLDDKKAGGGKVLYMDPFLSALQSRQVPPLLRPEQVTNAFLVFGSHDHGDHIDRDVWPALAEASPEARFVVPELLRDELAASLDIAPDRFIGMDDGRTVEVEGVEVSAVAAAHEFLDRDEATGRYPYLGYVVKSKGCTIYHAGDTCLYEGLQTKLLKLTKHAPDIAFLPINGRDARRLTAGCIGNMTYQEAADLAGALTPALTVPAHFEMFEGNMEDPALFADYMAVKYSHLKVVIPEHGKRVVAACAGA